MRSNKITWRISALLLSFLLILGGLSLTSCSETVADVLDIAIDLLEEESSDPTTDAPAAPIYGKRGRGAVFVDVPPAAR